MNNNILIITILIILIIFSFCIGYILGKITTSIGVYNNTNQKTIGFFDKEKHISLNKTKISIDDSTFVSEIKTDHLEKKYDTLGDKKTSNEDISSSISKLKNMKG